VISLRRVRGGVLRLIRRRPFAIAVGLALLVPSLWVELSGRSSAWWTGGVTLVAGATGAALLWTGLVGARPDWIDEDRA
jgi:hypothetical protein